MKFRSTILSLACLLTFQGLSAQNFAQDGFCCTEVCPQQESGFYVGALVGVNWLQTTSHGFKKHVGFDTGFAVGASIGYKLCNQIRVEGEYAYRRNEFKTRHHHREEGDSHRAKGNFNSSIVMFNALYDFCPIYCLTPYVGGGIGYAWNHAKVKFDECSSKGSHNRFAYQVIAGASKSICEKTDLGLEYRFLSTKKHMFDHALALTARRYF